MSAPHPITCICSDCELKRKVAETIGKMTSRIIPYVDPSSLEAAMTNIMKLAMPRQIEKKGSGAFASMHECLGALTEEMHEFEHAVHDNDETQAARELIDLAVEAIWGVASYIAYGGTTSSMLEERP